MFLLIKKGAVFIELKRKPAELLLRGTCGFLAVFTLFMLTLSLIFSFGGDAPSLFGKNIYIVKTGSVEFLKPGTAILTSVVPAEEILQGNIVVFKNSENKTGIAEIVSSELSENVYGFKAVSERGIDITLTQSQIVGKAMHYSDIIGGLVGFAKSPAGVLVIAVLPCLIILVYEGSKSFFAAARSRGEVPPVKKQDEVPTYIPRQKVSAAISAYSKTESLEPADYALNGRDEKEYPFFKPPKQDVKPEKAPQVKKPVPLSQKRLNDAIAEVNSRKAPKGGQIAVNAYGGYEPAKANEPVISLNPKPAISQTREINTSAEKENVKRYTPKKNALPRTSQTGGVPRLDQLLKEDESENTRYNIADILFSLDNKK